jgi:hypothetical protein
MSDSIKRLALIVIMLLLIVVVIPFLLWIAPAGGTRVYDCGMAEWHPDIPIEVKEECRRLRANKRLTQT